MRRQDVACCKLRIAGQAPCKNPSTLFTLVEQTLERRIVESRKPSITEIFVGGACPAILNLPQTIDAGTGRAWNSKRLYAEPRGRHKARQEKTGPVFCGGQLQNLLNLDEKEAGVRRNSFQYGVCL